MEVAQSIGADHVVLLSYSTEAIAGQSGGPYNVEFSSLNANQLSALLAERSILQGAIVDLKRNVNPGFVCKDAVRSVRRVRKQYSLQ